MVQKMLLSQDPELLPQESQKKEGFRTNKAIAVPGREKDQ